MTKDYAAISDAQDARAAALFKANPEIMRAHRQAMTAAQQPKALDSKTTELMALAIAIAQRCEGCVVFHTLTARKKGASRDELLDTIAVAIEMGGGPATVYGADALAAWDQDA
jgi:AhpD family alkylhydroperoxidase